MDACFIDAKRHLDPISRLVSKVDIRSVYYLIFKQFERIFLLNQEPVKFS